MIGAFLFTATFGDCFRSRIFCSLLLAKFRDPGSAVSSDDETCLRPTKTIRRQSSLSAPWCYSFFILCGLCIGHVFLLHRSGIVFGHELLSIFLASLEICQVLATPARGLIPARGWGIAPPDENNLRTQCRLRAAKLLFQLMWIMHWAFLFTATFGDCFRPFSRTELWLGWGNTRFIKCI